MGRDLRIDTPIGGLGVREAPALVHALGRDIAQERAALRLLIRVAAVEVDVLEAGDVPDPQHPLVQRAEALRVPLVHWAVGPERDLIRAGGDPGLGLDLHLLELILEGEAESLAPGVGRVEDADRKS